MEQAIHAVLQGGNFTEGFPTGNYSHIQPPNSEFMAGSRPGGCLQPFRWRCKLKGSIKYERVVVKYRK
jgi:hypothetical protein